MAPPDDLTPPHQGITQPGAWIAVHGVWIFVPDDARPEHIDEALKTLERVYHERYLADTADCGGT